MNVIAMIIQQVEGDIRKIGHLIQIINTIKPKNGRERDE